MRTTPLKRQQIVRGARRPECDVVVDTLSGAG
jgi:hypothetical protein